MLLEFSFRNYGPFQDWATLDMEKDIGDEHPDNLMICPETGDSVLRSAVIFGINSSGKTQILAALGELIQLVRTVPTPNSQIHACKPFRLSTESLSKPTEMRIRFTTEGILYEYGISFDSTRIVFEHLYSYPNGRVTKVFEREGGTFKFTRSEESSLRRISDMTSPNTPLLTTGAQFNNAVCMSVHRYLTTRIVVIGDAAINLMWQVTRRMSEDPWMKERMVKAMSIADFGISDLVGESSRAEASEIRDIPPQILEALTAAEGATIMKNRLEMRHDFPDADVEDPMHYFPYSIESRGTLQMFSMMGPVIDALRNGGVVMFDEFGSSLHTYISRWILEQFEAPSNPNGAQIVVNTHDLLLMDTDTLFRRDQIYFTDKDRRTGAASLYSLSDFKGIRKDMDILKSYMSGRFDAIPDIDRGDLL